MKRRKNTAADSIRRADHKWLREGGLDRPHTKIGVASAKRLLQRTPDRAAELRAYIKSAPKKMPVSDYEAEHGKIPKPKSPRALPPKLRYREISGGAPGLGKRR